MKKLLLLILFTLISCSHRTHKPSPQHDGLDSFEYCGGDMWGFIGPLPGDDKKETYETVYPGVAYLESGKKTFLLTLAMEIYGKVDIEFVKNEMEMIVNGESISRKPLEVAVHRIPHSPHDLYPSNKYILRQLDTEKNQWQVTKLNPFFGHLFTGKPEIVTLPKTQVAVVKNGKFHFPEEKEFKKTMLISVIPIWPIDKPLANIELQATIPAFTFRGRNQNVQKFNFSFNLRDWENRAKKDKSRCPSLEELFRWNR